MLMLTGSNIAILRPMHEKLSSFVEAFMTAHPTVDVDGEYYELPGTVVYSTATKTLPNKGRIEVNAIGNTTPADFEWRAEITIKDKEADMFIHMLLRRDDSIVETYGKTVTPVDEARFNEIYSILNRLAI